MSSAVFGKRDSGGRKARVWGLLGHVFCAWLEDLARSVCIGEVGFAFHCRCGRLLLPKKSADYKEIIPRSTSRNKRFPNARISLSNQTPRHRDIKPGLESAEKGVQANLQDTSVLPSPTTAT